MSIIKEIVFTKTPLRQVYRYNDVFQLVPYRSDTGTVLNKYVVDYPCVLEYKMPQDANEKRDFEGELTKEREICILLTAFSTYRVFQYDIHASSWGTKIPIFALGAPGCDEGEIRSQVSEYYYPGFYYKDIGKTINGDDFTEVDESERMELLNRYSSFISNEQDRFDVRNDAVELRFSEETNRCLDAFYALDNYTKKKIHSAARLISDCIALKDYRYSLSFVAGVSALETLASVAFKDEKSVVEACGSCHALKSSPYICPDCGRPIWGPTAKVKKLLKQYVSSKESDVREFKRIYDRRSKITHTGDIFTMDSVFQLSGNKQKQEHESLYNLITYARVAMINLMLSRKSRE